MKELMCHERGKNMQKPYSQVRLSKRSTRASLWVVMGPWVEFWWMKEMELSSRVIDHTKQFDFKLIIQF